jgi:hypothetical protein
VLLRCLSLRVQHSHLDQIGVLLDALAATAATAQQPVMLASSPITSQKQRVIWWWCCMTGAADGGCWRAGTRRPARRPFLSKQPDVAPGRPARHPQGQLWRQRRRHHRLFPLQRVAVRAQPGGRRLAVAAPRHGGLRGQDVPPVAGDRWACRRRGGRGKRRSGCSAPGCARVCHAARAVRELRRGALRCSQLRFCTRLVTAVRHVPLLVGAAFAQPTIVCLLVLVGRPPSQARKNCAELDDFP